jgi:hypothetical protein
MILVVARHAAPATCTSWDKESRFSERTKIKGKTNETILNSNSILAKSMTHHNQTKEPTPWFLKLLSSLIDNKHGNYSHVADSIAETWVDTPNQSSYVTMLPEHNDVQPSEHGALQKLSRRKRSMMIALEYLQELLLPSSGQRFGYSKGWPVV